MKKLWILFLFMSNLCMVRAQNKMWLTGKKDTSYSTYSAFNATVKNYPGISIVRQTPSKAISEERGLVYCTIGNRQLHIDAFIPKKVSVKKKPAVLIIHGGGWRTGNRGQHIPLAQRLAAAGYASFTVEYRLSTEALYPAAIYDLKSALKWIRANAKKYHIDDAKVAVLGFSAGGELAAFVGATAGEAKFEGNDCNAGYNDSVQAIVDIDGTLSFVHPDSGEGDDTHSISAGTYWFGYSKKENPALWQDASPLNHADHNKAPILFINSSVAMMHAGRDDFRKTLEQKHIYSEVHTFENSPHSFCLFNPWFEPTVNYVVGFLNKVFKK